MAYNKSHNYGLLYRAMLIAFVVGGSYGQELASNYYDMSCPKAISVIRSTVGCDGSVLLDDTASFTGEKTAGPNMNSLRGFEVIDSIKSQLGGPSWNVQLGRRDSTTASYTAANTNLPSPFLDLPDLISSFSDKGFTIKQMVALSGAHTIGHARCLVFRNRVHGAGSDIESTFAESLKSACPPLTGNNDTLSPLDAASPSFFDNAYFTNLISKQGLLHSDQQLFGGGSTDAHVTDYGKRPRAFYADFAAAMVKMGGLGTLTGTEGEVRANCRRIN
ncbi:Cationic peroxidase 1 [Linum grandiflorum]